MKKLLYRYPLVSSVLIVAAEWYGIVHLLVPRITASPTLEEQLLISCLDVMGIVVVAVLGTAVGFGAQAQGEIQRMKQILTDKTNHDKH